MNLAVFVASQFIEMLSFGFWNKSACTFEVVLFSILFSFFSFMKSYKFPRLTSSAWVSSSTSLAGKNLLQKWWLSRGCLCLLGLWSSQEPPPWADPSQPAQHYEHRDNILMGDLAAPHPLYSTKTDLLDNLSFYSFPCELFLFSPPPQKKKNWAIYIFPVYLLAYFSIF